MKKKIFIVLLCILVTTTIIVHISDTRMFTKKEYDKLYSEVLEFFKSENFECVEDYVTYEHEVWSEKAGRKESDEYIVPTRCKKKSEVKVNEYIYNSEIIYNVVSYEDMLFYKGEKDIKEFTMKVENTFFPKEKILGSETIIRLYQETKGLTLYLDVDKYDERTYTDKRNTYIYIGLSNSQSDAENYKYYQETFKIGLPQNAKDNTKNPEEVSDYFDLLVEKGYAENLLNEFKVNKEEADEIAKRFEKSEIYAKIYNLKY